MVKSSSDRQWIKARIVAKKMTVGEVAAQLGVEQPTISKIWTENRKVTPRETAVLARILGMTTDEFVARLENGGELPGEPPAADPERLAFELVDAVASVQPLDANQRFVLVRKITAILMAALSGQEI